jgi:Flp pilus assembly protein TadD
VSLTGSRRFKTVFAAIFVCAIKAQSGAHVTLPDSEVGEGLLIDIQHSIQTGDLHSARTQVRDALQRFPGDPRLYNFLGVIDAQERNFDGAKSHFQRAIEIAPRFVGAYLNLGRLYEEESARNPGFFEKALQIYRQASAIEPDNVAVLEKLAELYEAQGRFADARQTLTRELDTSGKASTALLTRLSRVAYKSGDLEGALGYLAHARDVEPRDAAVRFLFGLICIELKLPPEAEDSLRTAVRLDPQNPYYSYALGAVLLQRHNPDEAIRYFRTFRESRKEDSRGGFALGVAYFDAGQMEAARREFETAAKQGQTRAGALLYLGRVALREENRAEAADHFRAAIQTNPSMAEPYVELAVVQIRRKEYEAADQNLAHALRLAPDNYQANFNLLFLYKRTNDVRTAEQERRVAALRSAAEERERVLLRGLDIRPY